MTEQNILWTICLCILPPRFDEFLQPIHVKQQMLQLIEQHGPALWGIAMNQIIYQSHMMGSDVIQIDIKCGYYM